MSPLPEKQALIQQLQQDILSLQGGRALAESAPLNPGLGLIQHAFPGRTFPVAALHEFLSNGPEDAAATSGFITGLLSAFMKSTGVCLWISTGRTIFPPALRAFGIAPERVIFVDASREKEALWAIEEALKCSALSAVVGELKGLGFTESRRLQLAAEQSRVTGFIHRFRPRTENVTASVCRWKVSSLSSAAEDGLPGVGLPRWHVQLLKVRNGRPGTWQTEWTESGFRILPSFTASVSTRATRKTG